MLRRSPLASLSVVGLLAGVVAVVVWLAPPAPVDRDASMRPPVACPYCPGQVCDFVHASRLAAGPEAWSAERKAEVRRLLRAHDAEMRRRGLYNRGY